MRAILAFLVALLVAAALVFLVAGRGSGPAIQILAPEKVIGQNGTFEVAITAPKGNLTRLDVAIEQNDQRYPVFSLGTAGASGLKQEAEDRVRVTGPVGRTNVKELRGGPARIVVSAERPLLFGLRRATSEATRDIVVSLQPPRVAVVSMHHFVNHGGSELVIYRVTPPEVESGVRVGDLAYPGYPASGAGIAGADPSLKIAFFALRWDQDLNTPIAVYAKDTAGNEARANFAFQVFPKPYRKSRIEVPDAFLQRVVPPILEQTPDLQVDDPSDIVKSFLKVNGELRRRNAEALVALAGKTAPEMLWRGPFTQLTNSQVESSFADQRTYIHNGTEIDKQTHLGYDLAVTANVAIEASNRGRVVLAEYFGIYGNTVVLDHGMGLMSLYAHLSSIDVKPGDMVETGQVVGRSGMTGLAGGDHLHFTMLLQGQAVTPVDWWSKQWIEDRVTRKLREAGAPAATSPPAPGGAAPAPAAPGAPQL